MQVAEKSGTVIKVCKLCGETIEGATRNEATHRLRYHLEWYCEMKHSLIETDDDIAEQIWSLLQDEVVAQRLSELPESHALLKRWAELAKVYPLQTILNALSKLDKEYTDNGDESPRVIM